MTILAAILRLVGLGSPAELIFDETYYVKDAYTLLENGFEKSWPENANPDFEAGRVDTYLDSPSFVVHPPLGKWLIALGLAAFGADSSVGWRIGVALAGTLAVAAVCFAAWLLTRSVACSTVAGGLMAVDGHAIVMSRTALLDTFVMLFALLAFIAILLDRHHSARRLGAWLEKHPGSAWGPALWWRPWLVTAGILCGLASAVKWSGLYFLAAFALYTLVVDALSRRRAGVTLWLSGTLLKQAPVSFALTVPVAVAAHLATWWGWFATSGGYYRHWAEEAGNRAVGLFSWVPVDVQSWWHYQVATYSFHVGLSTSHPYQANPWSWLALIRPTSFHYSTAATGEAGCAAEQCAALITSVANPLIWWSASLALLYLVYRLLRFRQWQAGAILVGVAAGYFPWLLYPNRTVFQFYTIAFEPYLILALTLALMAVAGSAADSPRRRAVGIRMCIIFGVLVLGVSAFFYPVWTGMMVPEPFVRSHFWLPGWV